MVMIRLIAGHFLWFILYIIILKFGLYITDTIHKGFVKKWGQDINDYEYNRFTLKLYVTLFFIGVPILFWIGVILYIN